MFAEMIVANIGFVLLFAAGVVLTYYTAIFVVGLATHFMVVRFSQSVNRLILLKYATAITDRASLICF